MLIKMAFQMGGHGLAKFKKTKEALKNNDFIKAEIELLDSKWAKHDSPRRAEELAAVIREPENLWKIKWIDIEKVKVILAEETENQVLEIMIVTKNEV